MATDFPARIGLRTYFSKQHAMAAALFARQAGAIENAHHGQPRHSSEQRAYVTGAVISSASLLEAAINEFFVDIAEQRQNVQTLSTDQLRLARRLWQEKIPRTASFSIITKYQVALAAFDKPPFDLGAAPAQDVQLVVRIRNALVHYEPETLFPDENQHKLTSQLRGKFPENAMMSGSGNHEWPDKIVGHGCATWAVARSTEFVDEFFERIGLTSVLDNVRGDLATAP